MKNTFLILATTATFICACSDKGEVTIPGITENTDSTSTANIIIDATKIPEGTTSLEFDFIDKKINPNNDFYAFCNGSWLENTVIPDEESKWSNFSIVDKSNNKLLKLILMGLSTEEFEEGSNELALSNLYSSYMDTAARNESGVSSIDMDLEIGGSVLNDTGVVNSVGRFHKRGFGALFRFGIQQDLKDNTKYVAYISQGGMGLPSKDYYLGEDERSKNIRTSYVKHIQQVFKLAGREISTGDAKGILNFETELSKASMAPQELRNELAQYNVYSADKLKADFPGFQWDTYFNIIGLTRKDKIIVSQPDFIANIEKMLVNQSMNNWSNYLTWRVLNSSSGSLSTSLEEENFNFYGKEMRGRKKMKEDWERAISTINASPLSEVLGKEFVDQRFSDTAKAKINKMVEYITEVYDERIENLDWMSDETKVKAKEKLNSFVKKLGFPDKWRSFEGLELRADDFAANQVAMFEYEFADKMKKLNEEIDKSEWHMPPHIVNAYYNPVLNEIVFPAGIMQNPFFDVNYEDAVNYARMGAVIGHELTHGFDDQGAKYTADGLLNNWWTDEDSAKFSAKTQKLVDQYNTYEVLPGTFINGNLTLGENIADFGGLTIAYHAFKKSLEGKEFNQIEGYTPEQRFFIAFGQVWKNKIRDEALITRIKGDPHSPGKYRVNGTLANMPEFFEAFDTKEDDNMRQPADKIAKIW